MNRVSAALATAAAENRAALIIYLTFGDPDPSTSVELVLAAAEAGADIIELGVPFSDPAADGPVIARAMERALASGSGMTAALEAVARIRERSDVPLVLFGYYNPISVRGADAFARTAGELGIDAVLTVDLPVDEIDELAGPLAAHDVGVIPLVAPTTTPDRLERLADLAPPFVYYISITGITGAELDPASDLSARVGEVRSASNAPVCVGFGIKTAADAARIAAVADGVIVGSAIVRAIEDAPTRGEAVASVAALVKELRSGVGRT